MLPTMALDDRLQGHIPPASVRISPTRKGAVAMSCFRNLVSIISLALLSGLTASVAYAQTTYPLVCRGTTPSGVGPGGMSFTLWSSNQTPNARVGFVKGTGPAGSGLQPGQCSWLDRGINANEPASFTHHANIFFDGALDLGVIGTQMPMSFIFGGNMAAAIPYFPNYVTARMFQFDEIRAGTLLDPNQYFTFNVYNSGGTFTVTSIRCAGFCN